MSYTNPAVSSTDMSEGADRDQLDKLTEEGVKSSSGEASQVMSKSSSITSSRRRRAKKRGPVMSLREQLGRALVNRAKQKVSEMPVGPTEFGRTDPVTMGRGTPGQSQPPQALWKKSRVADEQAPHKAVPVDASVTRTLNLLIKKVRNKAGTEDKVLSMVLANSVQNSTILTGYSSRVIAALCIQVVAAALRHKILERGDLKTFGIERQAVTSACNRLWLQQDKLKGAIWEKGGSFRKALKLAGRWPG